MNAKKILLTALLCLMSATSFAQVIVTDGYYPGDGWRSWNCPACDMFGYLQPELTFRGETGFFADAQALSLGVKLNDLRSIGLRGGRIVRYIDAAPGYVYSSFFGAYTRRNFYIGPRGIISLYSDLTVGAERVYRIEGDSNFIYDRWRVKDTNFCAAWEPGIKLRFFRDMHIFLGPTLATYCIGAHIGIGI